KAHSALATVQSNVVDTVQRRSGEQRDRIHTAGTEALNGMRQHAEDSVKVAQQQLAAHAEKIASVQVDHKTAWEAAPRLRTEVVNGYSAAGTDARQTESKVAHHLSAAGQDATSSLSRVAPM